MANRIAPLERTGIFQCRGLHRPPAEQDRWGRHDLVWAALFAAFAALWWLGWQAPAARRTALLEGRTAELRGRLTAAERELYRIHAGLDELQRAEPEAWERAARARLGWLAPDEIVDVPAWRRKHEPPVTAPADAPPNSTAEPRAPVPAGAGGERRRRIRSEP